MPSSHALDLARSDFALVSFPRRTVRIDGPDRATWLNGVVTCDVAAAKGDVAQYGLALSRPGKIQSDLICVQGDGTLFVATSVSSHATLFESWQRMLVMEDADLTDAGTDIDWYLVVGPNSGALEFGSAVATGTLDLLGLGGRVVGLPRNHAMNPTDRILSEDDWLQLRLERLWPEYPTDYDDTDRPHEANLDQRAVSWTKGCYLGQEVVCMQQMRGKVKRRASVFRADALFASAPERDTAILDADGKAVGRVTSAANSQRAGAGLVMAQVEVASEDALLTLATGPKLSRVVEPL